MVLKPMCLYNCPIPKVTAQLQQPLPPSHPACSQKPTVTMLSCSTHCLASTYNVNSHLEVDAAHKSVRKKSKIPNPISYLVVGIYVHQDLNGRGHTGPSQISHIIMLNSFRQTYLWIKKITHNSQEEQLVYQYGIIYKKSTILVYGLSNTSTCDSCLWLPCGFPENRPSVFMVLFVSAEW